MGVVTMINLMIRYPAIKLFIKSCYIKNETDKLFDMLIGLQLEDREIPN